MSVNIRETINNFKQNHVQEKILNKQNLR
jgi:hypothetical protein